MGTYTTNYNLFMPSIGEQGWGTLVNGNFTTIDTTIKGLDTRITAVENEVNGALSCTSVTTSGTITANGGVGTTSLTTSSTITSTGLITANGGVKGNLTGKINISSFSSNSNNVKVYSVYGFNKSIQYTSTGGTGTAVTTTIGTSSVIRHNTGIFNVSFTDNDLLTSLGNLTCTIVVNLVRSSSSSYKYSYTVYSLIVTNTSNNTTVLSISKGIGYENSNYPSSPSATHTFAYNPYHTYKISLQETDSRYSGNTVTCSIKVNDVVKYVP